jgi:putative transposase
MNPLEWLSKDRGRRIDVVGIVPNEAAAIRLAGVLLSEQRDESSSNVATPLPSPCN